MAPTPKGPRGPTDIRGWQALMRLTLDRTKLLGIQTAWMEKAFLEGQSEQVLRKLGILTPTDIDREYPLKR